MFHATAQQVFVTALVFARVGAMVMTMPGLGDQPAPAQVRLAFSLLMALVIAPVVVSAFPAIPPTIGALVGEVIREILIGLAIGAILRAFLAALATAGEVMSIQTTLSFAQTANPTMAQQGSTLASFLSLLGVVLVMTTDLHQLFVGAMVRSFSLFPYGHAPPTGDAAQLAIRTVGGAFALGIQLAAPVTVFSVVFNLASGLVGRAMPQFQIFFAAAPLQVLLGLSLLALSLGTMGIFWVDRYREILAAFV
ncbi:MAG: flagellar type III secretion system protein FliR [Caulobacteraceae bacterium]|nr:flagellar type III secretion system protein FliR [Caulobacteraceae bacterium]